MALHLRGAIDRRNGVPQRIRKRWRRSAVASDPLAGLPSLRVVESVSNDGSAVDDHTTAEVAAGLIAQVMRQVDQADTRESTLHR
jgi:hypothetical protein